MNIQPDWMALSHYFKDFSKGLVTVHDDMHGDIRLEPLWTTISWTIPPTAGCHQLLSPNKCPCCCVAAFCDDMSPLELTWPKRFLALYLTQYMDPRRLQNSLGTVTLNVGDKMYFRGTAWSTPQSVSILLPSDQRVSLFVDKGEVDSTFSLTGWLLREIA